jgi:hypothetical protein
MPFGRLWFTGTNAVGNAIDCAKFSADQDAVIRVYDKARKVSETHEQAGDFKEP